MNKRVSPQTLAKYFPEDKQQLARTVTTADKIKPPPPKVQAWEQPLENPEPLPKERDRWSREKRHAFELLAPHALYFASTDGPVSITLLQPNGEVKKRIGHNRGCWPVKVGTTASHRDTVTPLLDKDPFFAISVKRRLWLPMAQEASTLAVHVAELLSKAAEEAGFDKLLHGYVDVGPNFSPEGFERHILLLAKRMDIVVWTEEAISKFLDKAMDNAKLKGIDIVDHKGRRIVHDGFVKLVDRMVEQERSKQFVGRRP